MRRAVGDGIVVDINISNIVEFDIEEVYMSIIHVFECVVFNVDIEMARRDVEEVHL